MLTLGMHAWRSLDFRNVEFISTSTGNIPIHHDLFKLRYLSIPQLLIVRQQTALLKMVWVVSWGKTIPQAQDGGVNIQDHTGLEF